MHEYNVSLQFRSLSTLVRKEVARFMRIWVQTLLPPVVTISLYFVIFGQLIGARIGQMGGFDYMAFVVPGLIMMAVINNSYANVVSSFYSARFNKSIEELLVSPMSNHMILIGFIAGGVLRGIIVAGLVTLVSLFFTHLQLHSPLIIFIVVVLASVMFALAGLINAVFATKYDDISIIPTFVLTPMTYLGGVFYSIELLPEFWQGVSKLNPILYIVNAFRFGFLGVSDVSIVYALAGIAVVVVILAGICLYLIESGTRLRS